MSYYIYENMACFTEASDAFVEERDLLCRGGAEYMVQNLVGAFLFIDPKLRALDWCF